MSLSQLFYAKNYAKQFSRMRKPRPRRHRVLLRRRPLLFKPLEPRLLLSADPTILGLVVDPSLSTALVVSPPVVGSASPAALDPAVNLPTTLRGAPGSTVTAPVNIDDAAGLESVDLQIAYDSAKLDLLAVRTGTVTGGATLLTNPADPTKATGTLTVGLALTTPGGPGGGSLLEVDYRIKPTAAGGPTGLDLRQVSLNEGGLLVTPTPVVGPDQTDGVITILSGNSPPVATNDAFNVAEDQALSVAAPGVLANDTDADANPLTALRVSNAAQGTLLFNATGSFTYTPTPNFNGADTFTYKANDGHADSNVATVSLTITSVNDAPVGTDTTVTTLEDTPHIFGTVDFGFTDPNDNPANNLSAVKVSTLPGAGSLTDNGTAVSAGQFVSATDITGGKLVFTPAANANGLAYATFTFQVQDDGGTASGGVDLDPSAKTMTVNVTAVNDPPVAVNDAYTIDKNTLLAVPANAGVLANDTDIEGDALTAVLVTQPVHGTLSLDSNGAFTYTPALNFVGADTFTYVANDTKANSNLARVDLTVTAPVINVDSQVRVTYSGFVLNRITDTFDTLATITNTSTGSLLLAPMSLVITSITPSSVTLDNATGETPDGRAFIAVQVPDGGLAPGASLSKILLKFSNPDRVRFSFTNSVLAVDPPANVTAGVRTAVAVDNGLLAIEGGAIPPKVEVNATPAIDWSGKYQSHREEGARSGGSVARGAQPLWVRDFVLDLAAVDQTLDPNADIQVMLPTAPRPLLTSRVRG